MAAPELAVVCHGSSFSLQEFDLSGIRRPAGSLLLFLLFDRQGYTPVTIVCGLDVLAKLRSALDVIQEIGQRGNQDGTDMWGTPFCVSPHGGTFLGALQQLAEAVEANLLHRINLHGCPPSKSSRQGSTEATPDHPGFQAARRAGR